MGHKYIKKFMNLRNRTFNADCTDTM